MPPRMDLYLRFSRMLNEMYAEYTNLVESYGIDEDWLDITLPDEQTKQFVIETIRAVLSAHGKSLWVQGEDE